MAKLKPHEFAKLLPLMSDPELRALTADIASRGMLDPVVLYQGKVLDGRNRCNAAETLGIEVRTVEFQGTDADARAFVCSKAEHRHLSESQRAVVALNFLPHLEEEAKTRKTAFLKNGPVVPQMSERGIAENYKRSIDLAAERFGVSGTYVGYAKSIREHDQKYQLNRLGEVFDGKKKLTVARREVQSAIRQRDQEEKGKAAPPVAGCTIHTGDCIGGLETLPARSARLVFMDPPYNCGIDYGPGAKADLLTPDEYLSGIAQCFEECRRVLTADGALWVLISPRWAADYDFLLRKMFAIRSRVIWREGFGRNQRNNFTPSHRHLFYCVKDEENFVFNRDPFTTESARKLVYNDKRASDEDRLLDDVWTDIARLVENAKERMTGFPTQLPLALVERVVLGCSQPGDTVIDPYTGSGTTAVVSCLNGRKFIGWEREKEFARRAYLRVRVAVAGGKSKKVVA